MKKRLFKAYFPPPVRMNRHVSAIFTSDQPGAHRAFGSTARNRGEGERVSVCVCVCIAVGRQGGREEVEVNGSVTEQPSDQSRR